MGPPIYIGGNVKLKEREEKDHEASMGPPIYIGGNEEFLAQFETFLMLQWGHRFTSVETNVFRFSPFTAGGFNGATDLHRWKLTLRSESWLRRLKLQWGHRFTSVETQVFQHLTVFQIQASMGPPIYIGGNFL